MGGKEGQMAEFSVHTSGHDSVLLWQQYNTLYISSFVEDVIFSYNGAKGQNQ